MGIKAYALVGFFIISLLFTQYAFAQFAGCGPNEVRNVEGECVSAFADEPTEIGMRVSVNAFEGSTTISVSGHSSIKNNDITIMVLKPDEKTVFVAQVSPDANGDFMKDVQIGGSQWELNGFYGVFIQQGSSSLYSFVFPIEIVNGYTRATSITKSTLEVITPFTVSTDKSSYNDGDTIKISGNVGTLNENYNVAVTLFILDPIGDIMTVDQLLTDSSGAFSKVINAGGPLWELTGDYEIRAQYGTQKTSITFYFVGTTTTPPTSPNTVFIPLGSSLPGCEDTNECFIPAVITVNVGDTVKWENKDSAAHTVTSGSAADGPDGTFDSNMFMSGQTFSHTFVTSGEYPYFDMLHPWQAGVVIVKGTPSNGIVDTTPPLLLTPSDMTIDATDSSGARVDYSVKAIDDNDGVLRPNCSPSSGSLFFIGETTVTCSATDNSGNSARKSFLITVNSPDVIIPSWVRDVAGFWCDNEIDDSSFIEAIQYLIDNDVIIVPITASSGSGAQEIPNWIKNNACWWSQGLITNSDFASGLQYLIGQGIIRV